MAAAWLLYPLGWFAYTLVRGESVDWYPYPFVDVSKLGYGGVFLRSAFLLAGFVCAAVAFLWIGNRRASTSAAHADASQLLV